MRLLGGKRRGISEMVGTVLTIAITIIAGAAVFSYVNEQAGATEHQYANAVGGTVQYLEERFTVIDMNFSASAASVWVYNTGQISLSPVQVFLYNNGRSIYLMYNATKIISYKPNACTTAASTTYESPILFNSKTQAGLSVPLQIVQKLILSLPTCSGASFSSGTSYTVSILGVNGNTVLYSQSM